MLSTNETRHPASHRNGGGGSGDGGEGASEAAREYPTLSSKVKYARVFLPIKGKCRKGQAPYSASVFLNFSA